MDGGSLVAQVLANHGVRWLFTLCGGHISPILVAAKRAGIRIVAVRDEKNAVFAADAVARLTGIPGVAAVTAGPGVTNTITAVKNAQLAQSPLVLLGGATATVLRGRGSLQDIDQMALIRPHVKWAARPNKLKEVVPALEEAFLRARSGVPGPVFVELAVDLLYDESVVREWYAAKTDGPVRSLGDRLVKWYLKRHLDKTFGGADQMPRAEPKIPEAAAPDPNEVHRAEKLLSTARRPVMLVGSQTMLNPPEVTKLIGAVSLLGIPTYLSGMARGLMGAAHPLQMRHKRRNALREADLVILSGVTCDFRLDYGAHIPKRATLIAANRCKADLVKNRKPDLAVLGDPHRFLCQLASIHEPPADGGEIGAARGEWLKTLRDRDRARDAEIVTMGEEKIEPINPVSIHRSLEERLAADSMIVADGGDFVATCSYITRPRRALSWLDPGVFGTLGVGAGFALGAKLVRPDADVWLVYGDGSAGYSLAELDTFVRLGIPVIALVGTDAGWMQITRDQVVILGDDVGTVLRRTDYHTVAEGWGARGLLLDDPAKIDATLDEAISISRGGSPVLVNAQIGVSDFRKGSISM